MRRTVLALRLTLVALVAAVAAACAHVVIDVAGDYLLVRDAYDGIAHQSRGLLLGIAGVCALVLLARALFDALDRRCVSTSSLLASIREAIGAPWRFAAETAALTIVLLGAMEYFDCAALGIRVEDVGELFGGSLLLGLTSAIACGVLTGWLAQRFLLKLSEYEPELVELVRALLRLDVRIAPMQVARRTALAAPISRGAFLGSRGRKRGPPIPAPR
ncbi:MAG: hypothetical protein JO199_08275 [Candidatus Eremiobacteraeota bacterium]|nr:hypothetical protein [Candidatus Eremiobacteraeota bacterium]